MPALISPFWLLIAAFFYALAWLIPNHFPPWLGFHADALAALVTLLLSAAILLRSKERIHLGLMPFLALVCLAIIALQYWGGMIAQLGVAWVQMLYVYGFLMALLIGHMWEKSSAQECADFIFAAVLIGATISWLMQLQQWLGVNLMGSWLLYVKGRYSANLAQPNQLGSLIILGILACAWFYNRKKISALTALLLAAALFFGLALTESRTGWLNTMAMLLALLLWRKRPGVISLLKPAILLVVFYALCVMALPYLNALLNDVNTIEGVRGIKDQSRIAIWKLLSQGAILKPWLGYGWGQVSYVQFMPNLPVLNIPASLGQSHNLFLDLILWNGVPIGIALSVLLLFFAVYIFWRIKTVNQLLMVLFLSVLFIHAMLEYPLQYAYFLLLFGLMAGALAANMQLRSIMQLPHWAGWLIFLPLIVAYAITISDYLKVETSFYGLRFEQRRIATNIPATPPDVVVLTQLRDSIIFARVKPENTHDADAIEKAEHVVKSFPSTLTMYKLASMYAFAGQEEKAKYWMKTAARITAPEQCPIVAAMWQEQAALHPAMARVKLEPCPPVRANGFNQPLHMPVVSEARQFLSPVSSASTSHSTGGGSADADATDLESL